MHLCGRCRTFVNFDARQQCVVLKSYEKCELCTRHGRICDVFKSLKCKPPCLFLTCFFHSFIKACFAEQRLNRALAKMKNERTIAITEKSRINKKIRRILAVKNRITRENAEKKRSIVTEKKRVNVKFLKCVFLY